MSTASVVCQDCGELFYVTSEERWKRVCRFCYRREMDARKHVPLLEREIARLRQEIAELTYKLNFKAGKTKVDLDAARLRQLLQLCHPDKHKGSKTATVITQWLLDARREVA